MNCSSLPTRSIPEGSAENPGQGRLVGNKSYAQGPFQPQVGRSGLAEAVEDYAGGKADGPDVTLHAPLFGQARNFGAGHAHGQGGILRILCGLITGFLS